MGKKADRDALQPGDLLSFVNTYEEGLSHVGIYLGNDRFEHASDDVHGVTVSNLNELYWEERFYRAVRPR
jgi:peptidoglycan DL-endopeptidase LytE